MDVIRDFMKSPRIDKIDEHFMRPSSFKAIANAINRPVSACGGGMVIGNPISVPMSTRSSLISPRTSNVILISPRNMDIEYIMNMDFTVSERLVFL